MVQAVTGLRPETCPWQAFGDPVVLDVLGAFRSVQNGMGATPALLLATDPPHHIWDGLTYFCHVRAKVHEHEDELERERNKGPRRG